MFGAIFDGHNRELTSGLQYHWRSGSTPNIPQCTKQPHIPPNYPSHKVTSADLKNNFSEVISVMFYKMSKKMKL
jgi:hypothetical protein